MKQASFIAIMCLAVLLVIAAILIFDINRPTPPSYASIASFEECVTAGYPILESYPPQCTTPDGRTFVQSATVSTSTLPAVGQGSTTAPSKVSATSTSAAASTTASTTRASNHIIKN